MQLAIIRELMDALMDAGTGLAAQLADIPVEAGDALVAPGDVLIIDGMTDDALILGEQFDRGKTVLVLVVPDGPVQYTAANIKGEYANATLPVAITVVYRGSLSPSAKLRTASYVLRGIVLSLKAYFTDRGRDRTRNEIVLLGTDALTVGAIQDDGVGGVGAAVFTVHALDRRALQTV